MKFRLAIASAVAFLALFLLPTAAKGQVGTALTVQEAGVTKSSACSKMNFASGATITCSPASTCNVSIGGTCGCTSLIAPTGQNLTIGTTDASRDVIFRAASSNYLEAYDAFPATGFHGAVFTGLGTAGAIGTTVGLLGDTSAVVFLGTGAAGTANLYPGLSTSGAVGDFNNQWGSGWINVITASTSVTTGSLVAPALDTGSATTLTLASTNATKVDVSKAGVTTEIKGLATVDQTFRINDKFSCAGDTGTSTQVLHGNSSSVPTWSSVVANDLASDAVTSAKIASSAVTGAKITLHTFKMLTGIGHNGVGAVSIPGARIGDSTQNVFGISAAATNFTVGTAFESVITVDDQIQQLAVGDLSSLQLVVLLQTQ